MFYLGEYVNTVTVAAIAVTLFLGGWRGPHPDFLLWLWPLLWFLFKVTAVIYVYILVRGTLAADALRPTDELRLEAADPVRAGVGAGDGVRRRRPRTTSPARSSSQEPRSCSACWCSAMLIAPLFAPKAKEPNEKGPNEKQLNEMQ